MRVQRLVMPNSGVESWTLLGDDGMPVEPAERFLAFLGAVERSPNTIKACAHDLKDWFEFLGDRDLDWSTVTVEDVAAFVVWLRLPPAGRAGEVAVLPSVRASTRERPTNSSPGICPSFYPRGVPSTSSITAAASASVAVGTPLRPSVSGRPPHRSQRAGLPHWAPNLGRWRRSEPPDKGASRGPGGAIGQRCGPSAPGEPVPLAAAPQRPEPEAPHLVEEGRWCIVARCSRCSRR